MRLILVRHARAGEPNAHRYPDDDLRPLDFRGRREHRAIARALARMDLGVEYLLTSPRTRAIETAQITAEELGISLPPRIVPELGPEFSVAGFLSVLDHLPSDAVIAAFGHEPDLRVFAGAMLHSEGSVPLRMGNSSVLGLSFDGPASRGRGVLLCLLPAELILPLAR